MAPLELICVAVWSFAVAVAGGLAGLVLGNLRLPVVLQFSTSAAAGAGANVAISAASALTASIAHWRGERIDWRLFWLMAPPSLLGGILGGVASGLLPQRLLLAIIALVVLYGAVEIARQAGETFLPRIGGTKRFTGEEAGASEDATVAITIAFAVGVLGGLVGLILGTLRLPAMVRWLGTAPKAAVGTNAATGVVVGIGGLIGHLAGGVDWNLLAAGCLGAVPGAYLGAHLTGRLDDDALLRAIAVILVVAGLALGAQAVI
ncbi:MAG TPA: sulfite exporter TauE/SafE family protein [Solirubrobacterales bacterium]|nr:sulfite exporter TauE/SafE family protein [Solirubrobacterales bacterium]